MMEKDGRKEDKKASKKERLVCFEEKKEKNK